MKLEKYHSEIGANGSGIIRVINRSEGFIKGFPSFVQLQIETEDMDAFVNIRDEQVDELIETLTIAKMVVPNQ